jgi:CubicO group peptidase (beta-lactamase class C family)
MHSFCWRALSVLVLSLSVRSAAGQAPTAQVAREVKGYLSDIGRFGFSGAVLVARGDTVLARSASGWADRDRRIPNDIRTAFSLGSLSKQFTAAAVLRLEMQGRLHVTDSLSRFFPSAPPDKAGITLLQLLTHQGGVASSEGGRACLSRDGALNAIFSTPLHFPPGSDYDYSNAGYNVLAAVVEIVAGEPFETFVHRELWTRAGLQRTGFMSDSGRWAPPGVALGYNVTLPTTPFAPACQWNRKGAGAVISTVDDLFRWGQALDHNVVLDSTRREELFRPRVATHETPPTTYAFGWAYGQTSAGAPVRFHRGDLLPDGFNTGYFRYAEGRTTIIVLSNRTADAWGADSYPVQDALEAILFGGRYGHPPTDPATSSRIVPAKYLGTYSLPNGGRFDVVREPVGVAITAQGQEAVSALVRPASQWSSSKARKYNELSAKLLVLASTRDTAGLRTLLGETSQASRVIRIWDALAGNKGAVISTRMLGSVPTRTPDGPATYVQAVFASDSSTYTLWWDWDGSFLSIHDGVDSPARFVLSFIDASHARGWDLFNSQTIRVQFETAASGDPDALIIETPRGPLRAIRTRPAARPQPQSSSARLGANRS